MIWFNRLFFRP